MRLTIRLLTPLVLLLAMLLPAGGATAAAESVRGREVTTEINTCNEETVVLEGFFEYHVAGNEKGTVVQKVTLHAAGVGDQGNEYVLNVHELFKEDADRILVQHRYLISKGAAPNQLVLLTLNFNTDELIIEADCRG